MAAAFIPVIMATVVLLFVPRDEVRARKTDDGQEVKLEPFKVSRQFVLGVAFLFSVYAMNELIRLSTPIALKDLRDGADAATASLITFSLGGLVSAVGVLLLAPMVFRTGALSQSLRCCVCVRGRRLSRPRPHQLDTALHPRLHDDRRRHLLSCAGDQYAHRQQRAAFAAWHRLRHRRDGPGPLFRGWAGGAASLPPSRSTSASRSSPPSSSPSASSCSVPSGSSNWPRPSVCGPW